MKDRRKQHKTIVLTALLKKRQEKGELFVWYNHINKPKKSCFYC